MEEEDALTAEALDLMVQQGDEDAMLGQQFKKDLEDLMQEVPDLQNALVSYQEARQRISERRRHRGFWPSKSRWKGYGARGFRKGGPKGGKDKLLASISRTHCKVCGALDHWKAECPQRRDCEQPREQANVFNNVGGAHEELPQVIIEEMDEAGVVNQSEVCFHAQESVGTRKHPLLSASVRQQAVRVWSNHLSKHWHNPHKRGNGDKDKMLKLSPKDHKPVSPSTGDSQETQPCHRIQPLRPTMETSGLKPETSAECLASQTALGVSNTQVTQGLAILDTGASRSVIGEHNVRSCRAEKIA